MRFFTGRFFFEWFFSRKPRGVFLHSLTITAAHTGTNRDGRFAKPVAEPVRGREGLTPAFGTAAIHQVELTLIPLESRGLNSKQPDRAIGVPVRPQQAARVLDEIDIQLRR